MLICAGIESVVPRRHLNSILGDRPKTDNEELHVAA